MQTCTKYQLQSKWPKYPVKPLTVQINQTTLDVMKSSFLGLKRLCIVNLALNMNMPGFVRACSSMLAFYMIAQLSACSLMPTEANPIVGMWTWRHVSGKCTEIHFYKGDGDMATWSGKEILRKSYQISAVEPGRFRVDAVVIESNGAADCLGSTTSVGAKSTMFIWMQNGGGHLTCRSLDSLSCDGSAVRRERL